MNPSLLSQELARMKHAETLREATRRYAVLSAEPEPPVARKPRFRLRRRPRPAIAR